MIEKYLSYQCRLYELHPELATRGTAKAPKNARLKGQVNGHVTDGSPSAQVSRLQVRIAKIRSDILFDQQEAEVRWAAMREQLSKDMAARRRLAIDDSNGVDSRPNGNSIRRLGKGNIDEESGQEGDEPEIMLADLFDSLPETSSDLATGSSITSAADVSGTRVELRDFGRWNGVGPRRVLEEACRARRVCSSVLPKPTLMSHQRCFIKIVVQTNLKVCFFLPS